MKIIHATVKAFTLTVMLVFFGSAGFSQTNNESLGAGAGASISSGDRNTMIGDSCMTNATTSSENTALGFRAGFRINSSSTSLANYNVLIGMDAGYSIFSSDEMVAIGYQAMYACTTGTDGVFVGYRSGYNNNATDNTFVGTMSGYSNIEGVDNTFIGEEAGKSNTDGDDNTFIGEDAGYNNTTGSHNTAVGSAALRNSTTGFRNTGIGNEALYDITTGFINVAVGDSAGTDVSTGVGNTFIGQAAGAATELASYNTFIGCRAGYDNNRPYPHSAANRNTYVGFECGYSNREGEDNVGMGAYANDDANNIVDVSRQVYLGSRIDANSDDVVALGYNVQMSTASARSIGIGSNTQVTAQDAICVGSQSNSGGQGSMALGAGTSATADNAIAIGYLTSVTAANEVYIGNNATTSIGGPVNWTATSDGRFKSNVQENIPGLDFIRALRPVSYQLNGEEIQKFYGNEIPEQLKAAFAAQKEIQYSGFIAQEVQKAAASVDYNFSGVKVPEDDSKELYGLRYAEFVVPIVKSIQELEARCEALEAEKNSANDLLGRYEEIICEQESRLKNYEALLLKVDARLNGLEQEMANIRLGGSNASK